MQLIVPIVILIFIAITFLQSGIDKIVDWKGNLAWLKSHLAKTFIGRFVPLALFFIALLEIAAGLTAVAGGIILGINGDNSLAKISGILAAITLLFLFFGQRIAKDYPGAQTLVIYLIPVLMLLYIL